MSEPRPFNISIFVAEGLPDGLKLLEKSNWVGLGIICPRGRYPIAKKRKEFSGSGVYILVGSEAEAEYPTLYIGEAETVRTRLDSHYASKDFWQQAIVFTTRGDPLNKAEVQYLEARLMERAIANKRCQLDNTNKPQRPSLSEKDEAQCTGYLDEMLSLLPVIGIRAFETPPVAGPGRRIYRTVGRVWDARGYESSNGFVVQEGSIARKSKVKSMSVGLKTRQQIIEDKVVVENEAGLRFVKDHEFTSPSMAAAVVTGRNINGREAWKDDQGITLKEYQEREAKG